jgi:hypothetical protein
MLEDTKKSGNNVDAPQIHRALWSVVAPGVVYFISDLCRTGGCDMDVSLLFEQGMNSVRTRILILGIQNVKGS